MIKLIALIFSVSILAGIIGMIYLPKERHATLFLWVGGFALAISILIFGYLYRAAHTHSEGSKPIERDSDGQIRVTDTRE